MGMGTIFGQLIDKVSWYFLHGFVMDSVTTLALVLVAVGFLFTLIQHYIERQIEPAAKRDLTSRG